MFKIYLSFILLSGFIVSCGSESGFNQADDAGDDYSISDQSPIKSTATSAGKIVYSNGGIFIMDSDGNNQVRLTSSGNDDDPQISPSGSKIAFISSRSGSQEIYLINSDGSNEQKITACGGVDSFSWSHDGSKIGLTNCKNQGYGLYLLNISDRIIAKIADNLFIPGANLGLYGDTLNKGISFSPSDSSLLIGFRNKIYRYQVATKQLEQAYAMGSDYPLGQHELSYPVYSPDGSRIAFIDKFQVAVATPCYGTINVYSREVYSIDAGGNNLRVEHYQGFANDVSHISWSSDSNYMVFEHDLIDVCTSGTTVKIYKVRSGSYGQDVVALPSGLSPHWGGFLANLEPKVTVSTDNSVYERGQPIKITLSVENPYDLEIAQGYAQCCPDGYMIDGQRLSLGRMCCMSVGYNPLAPHEKKTFSFTYTGDLSGGNHAVSGAVSPHPSSPAMNISVTDASTPPPPPPICGDAIVGGVEQCDDGNTRNGDGCSSDCHLQDIEPSEIPWSINLHPENTYEYADSSKPLFSSAIANILDLGAKYVRIDIPWRDVQPVEAALTENEWDYSKWALLRSMLDYIDAYGLTPIVVLGRIPDWAKGYYTSGNKDHYWDLWTRFCRKATLELDSSSSIPGYNKINVHYYQLSNEVNLGFPAPPDYQDFIDKEDDYLQFSKCYAGLDGWDTNGFETIANPHANTPYWEDDLKDWLAKAGDSINIIGIDHYPGAHYLNDGTDWWPLDQLINNYMPNYGKKGAIAETGYPSQYNLFNPLATEASQHIWINTALPIIKEKTNGKGLLFANFYELYDLNSNGDSNPENFYGILKTDGTPKLGYSALRNQIRGKKVGSMGAFGVGFEFPSLEIDEEGGSDCRDQIPEDKIGDPCNHDEDGDGVQDDKDLFPFDSTDWADADSDGVGNNADPDDDNDGTIDSSDAFVFNASESYDTDGDGIGNNIDPDDDDDGVLDGEDTFPQDVSEQSDLDADGIGDNADPDDDGDGLDDAKEILYNLNTQDTDSDDDGVIDGEEPDPFGDADYDGLVNAADFDSDNDGISDGVEMGISGTTFVKSKIAGTSINSGVNIFDSDPQYTTDPLKADTDGGGLADGEEDINHNGMKDVDETDPLDASDDDRPTFVTGGNGGCSLTSNSKQTTANALIILCALLFAGVAYRKKRA